jgi:hypothetical protein
VCRLKRWLFHPDVEKLLSADKVAERILFHDAVEALNRGQVGTTFTLFILININI